jgi:D-glycero-alpha-D-manno-heptose-7-phosphate kinase
VIITRTPVRIPLGGGGTDLPSYYATRGGALISAAINKYIYVTVNKRFEQSIRLSYSQTEIVDDPNEIRHPIVREALKLLDLHRHLEITTIADVPSNVGLGTSSTFTVGLLNALHTYKRDIVSLQSLAEEAFHIEHDLLGEPVGKQDQYLATFGRITTLDIERSGYVRVNSLWLSDDAIDQLESNVLLFYTGIRRSASEVLADQDKASQEGEEDTIRRLDAIKEIGLEIRHAFQHNNLRRFGELLDVHWQTKKRLSSKVTSPEVDRWYEIARASGALGGKIMGAGGGGFFLFYCDNDKHKLRQAMAAEGLREVRFRIDQDGSKVLVNL